MSKQGSVDDVRIRVQSNPSYLGLAGKVDAALVRLVKPDIKQPTNPSHPTIKSSGSYPSLLRFAVFLALTSLLLKVAVAVTVMYYCCVDGLSL